MKTKSSLFRQILIPSLLLLQFVSTPSEAAPGNLDPDSINDVIQLEAPAIASQPQSRSATIGDNATFQVAASGSSTLTFQWYKDGISLPAETNADLTLLNVTMTDEGLYAVVVGNAAGSTTSASALLQVSWPDPRQSIVRLLQYVSPETHRWHSIRVTLSATLASLERGNAIAALNGLRAFQNKVRAEIAPVDPRVAEVLVQVAQDAVDALAMGARTMRPIDELPPIPPYPVQR